MEQIVVLFFIGLVASFLGTLAGGGGLLTLPSLLMVGLPIQSAIGINKFSGFVSAISGIPFVLKHKGMTIRGFFSTVFIGLLGGVLGAMITSHLTAHTMNGVAFVLLLFAFFVTLKNKTSPETAEIKAHKPVVDSCTNAFVSIYDGAFGPGSITISMMYWIKLGHAYMEAVQRSRMLVLGSGFGSFIVMEQAGFVNWSFAITMAVASVLGTQIALAVLPKIHQTTAKRFLLSVTTLLLVQIAWKLFSY